MNNFLDDEKGWQETVSSFLWMDLYPECPYISEFTMYSTLFNPDYDDPFYSIANLLRNQKVTTEHGPDGHGIHPYGIWLMFAPSVFLSPESNIGLNLSGLPGL